MKNQKRKRALNLDQIKQKDDQTNLINKKRKKRSQNSEGSSDFSEFELESKDINEGERNEGKGKFWKKLLNKERVKNSGSKAISKQASRKKVQKKEKTSQRNINEDGQNLVQHMISFKKEEDSNIQFVHNDKISLAKAQKKEQENQDSEELITEHDKKQFNNKELLLSMEKNKQTLNRSRRQQKEIQINQKGMVETKGGLCFEVSVSDFVHKEQHISKKGKGNKQNDCKRKRKGRKINRFGVETSVPQGIFSKEQLLRRRRQAFQYGEYARRKTFHYY